MEYKHLGKSGLKVSPLCLGTMLFGRETPSQESQLIIESARSSGINFIDTADAYVGGDSERLVGRCIKTSRDHWVLATKLANKMGQGPNKGGLSRKWVMQACEESLRRLRTDYIDIYYLHKEDHATPLRETIMAIGDLIKDGKIKQFGFSEIAPSSLRRAASIHHVAAVQSEYSLSVRSPELGLVQTTAELGTALVAFSPLGRSLLTDRPHSSVEVEKMDWLSKNPRFNEPNLTSNIEATGKFRDLAAQNGVAAATLAIAWLLNKNKHIIPIPGTRSVKHFREHCEGARLKLSTKQMLQIEEVLPVGWAQGDRYSDKQWIGPEKYC